MRGCDTSDFSKAKCLLSKLIHGAGHDASLFGVLLRCIFKLRGGFFEDRWLYLKGAMAEALTSVGRDTDISKRGMIACRVNQVPLFSFQHHIYLGGSSYKCKIQPLHTGNWNCIYLLKTCKQAIPCVFLIGIGVLQSTGHRSGRWRCFGVESRYNSVYWIETTESIAVTGLDCERLSCSQLLLELSFTEPFIYKHLLCATEFYPLSSTEM